MKQQTTMTNYLKAFIHGLKTAGVKEVVISPGSRSTPLALLIHRDPDLTTYLDVDERSAGFFALGLSLASNQAVALLCTSGSAAANYYPAICEAEASHIPLVVLTTDRPAELRDVGAPQTMNQQELYRTHVKHFTELALPEDTTEMRQYSYFHAMKNTYFAKQAPAGPVHLNIPVREPLLPDLDSPFEFSASTTVPTSQASLDALQFETLIKDLSGKKGVIILGDQQTLDMAKAWLHTADKLNWPIIGDPLANLTSQGGKNLMRQADSFLPYANEDIYPEIVLRIGRLPLSKNVSIWLKNLPTDATHTILIDEGHNWYDQLHNANTVLNVSPMWLAHSLIQNEIQTAPTSWIDSWTYYQEIAEQSIRTMPLLQEMSETSASFTLLNELTNQANLFLANSNAIRFADRFALKNTTGYQAYGNRGVNGIDGIISTALGVTAATPEKANFLLVGDLTLFHDMNGLQMAKAYSLPLTIVLLNNNGGGIFSFLSQKNLQPSDFEPLFGTPLDLDFKQVATLYQAEYHLIDNLSDFRQEIQNSLIEPRFKLIEIKGEQVDSVTIYEDFLARLKTTLVGNPNEN